MVSPLDSVRALLDRDLEALGREVEAYSDDALPWVRIDGLPNPGGTLVLHLCGNLRHYVGAVLGHSAYVRDRPAEFSATDIPRTALVALVEQTRSEVAHALEQVTPEILDRAFPEPVGGMTLQCGDFLLHLASHLAYHLGQLDYHRRFVTGEAAGVGAVNIRELASAAD